MTPVPVDGGFTIPVALLANWLKDLVGAFLPEIMTAIITLSFVGVAIQKHVKPKVLTSSPFFVKLFDVSPFWYATRLIGMVLAIMTYFQIGPDYVHDPYTGGLLLGDGGLLHTLFAIFIFAGLFLPLLLNFGLLEFFGSMLTKVMRPLFKLPGRSSIDSLTSWLGDGTLGVVLTNKQYEEGYYSQREAAVIGTTFSVVSITFSLVVIEEVGLQHMFLPFYATILFAGFVAAIIMPRIPPLSRKPLTYANGQEVKLDETVPAHVKPLKFGFINLTPAKWGFTKAKEQADKNTSIKSFLQDGSKNVLDLLLGVTPVVMAFGTIALIIAENTSFFAWVGYPFVPILELMQVPEAAAASETLVVGFADMFLPAIFASGIESEMTRFIIACVSVTQLIYLSEVGGVLLGSKIPINFKDLVIIFLERTIITLPIIVVIAHFIF
ncbi:MULTISPECIES: YjiH family protein [Bacillaceae]|uniref:YjiH family protein n=1 Tax=Evansella alkalicola TaxID=745819 RepID=A0ABS6K093_9BACI|nr:MULTISPECIES: YjiH family protein [Bacillaceae]MBU9724271.1 YjiH family protein [Bacillus alkalicola]